MRKWWPLVAVSLGAFMLLVDVTIVNVALPDIARALGASFGGLQWVVDIYALVLAALLLTSGTVADRLGRRRVYVAGLTVFAVASTGCALAPSTGFLVAARAVQGVGAAAMFATTVALLSTVYQGRDRGVAFGVWGSVSGAAAAAGPILGGLLTQNFGWPWIFAVNLPVVVLAIAITTRSITADPGTRGTALDLAGMAAFTLTAAALTFGLIRSAETGASDPVVWGSMLLGAVSLAVFVAVERRGPNPMLDLALFGNPAFTGLITASALVGAAAWAVIPYASLWMQRGLGLGPIDTGLVLMPMSLVSFAVPLLVGRFGQRILPRYSVGLGLLSVGIGALLQARVQPDSTAAVLIPGQLFVGLGAGLALPPLSSAVMAVVPPERAGMAGGALNAARQVGLAMGVAVLGAVFSATAPHGVTGPDVASGLNTTYLVAALFGFAGSAVVFSTVRAPKPVPADLVQVE